MNIMTQNDDPIIRVEHMSAAYDGTVVLDDISFEVRRGEVFVILGGSGCGKSTLMKHMIGLYTPSSGNIYIEGQDIAAAGGKKRLEILRSIGVMYQSGALFGSMTLIENICLPLEEFTELSPRARVLIGRMKLKLVGLKGYGNHMPSEVSGGMKKRAAIARAMALDPAILFLDEPTAGLDPITSAEIDELILNLAGNLKMTFVIVTHELPSIYAIADRVIMLDKRTKGIIAAGPPKQLRDSSENAWVQNFFHRKSAPSGPGGTATEKQ